jgi:hypothetical protein
MTLLLVAALNLAYGQTAAFGQTGDGSATSATAAGKRRVTPDEAVAMAVANNLGLESARVTLGTKKRAADTAWNVFIPTVSVTGALSRDNEATTQTVSGQMPVGTLKPDGWTPFPVTEAPAGQSRQAAGGDTGVPFVYVP